MNKETYSVEGMHCSACASTVEKTLNNLEGVESASVNLLNEKAYINYNPSIIQKDQLFAAVSYAGYQLKKIDNSDSTQNYAIHGMSCASCAQAIEKSVNKIDTVVEANVNLATEILTVHWNETGDSDKIIQAVNDAGYQAELITSAKGQFNKEYDDKQMQLAKEKQHLIWMIFLAIPLFYIAMGPMLNLPLPKIIHPEANIDNYAISQFILATPLLFLSKEIFRRGFKSLLKGHPNMDSLVAIGTSAAYLQGIIMLLLILSHTISNNSHHIPLYFESAGIILTLITLGNYLEAKAKGQTSQAIQALMKLAPDTVSKVDSLGNISTVAIEQIKVDDTLLVKPGDRVPLDGTIISGESTIDESMLTGESLPVTKSIGDFVTGGSYNSTGAFKFNVTRIGNDTTLSQIIKMVQDAQGAKAPIARIADIISGYFVPIVISLAILSALTWYFILNADINFALNIFISVLIIACPCALGLATPTAMMVGIGNGAKKGILVKSGASLEQIQNNKIILLDKTGTITEGKPTVHSFDSVETFDQEILLSNIASIEMLSQHPLAQAIVKFSEDKKINSQEVTNFINTTGKGVQGQINSDVIAIGNQAYISEFSKIPEEYLKQAQTLASRGLTPIFVAVNHLFAGLLSVGDSIKSDSKNAIQTLKNQGFEVIMVTGDNSQTAHAIAQQVGISKVYAEILPEDKVNVVKELQTQGHKVTMVGDGINDAPALTLADVGIAIGSGSDVAIESADIIIIHDQLSDVVRAIDLSHQTLRNIKQNLFWAFIYNIIGIPFAMGVFYYFGGPLLNPMIAAIAMSFSSISVLLNALRIKE